MPITLLAVILMLLPGAPGSDPPAAETPAPPVHVFSELDGTWTGTFVGYDTQGRESYRISVEQRYRTVDDTTQKVTIRDTMPDGTVISGEGENTARRETDGSLTLRCRVRKSNGERVEHRGRLVLGPEGDEQIIWYSEQPGRIETFREVVRREGDGFVYEINAAGRYGELQMLMTGRYRKRPQP